jgi:hypothetical protein
VCGCRMNQTAISLVPNSRVGGHHLKREAKRLEPPDDERPRSTRVFRERQGWRTGDDSAETGLELYARERRTDARMNAATKPDMFVRIHAADVETIGILEHTRIAIRRTE